MEDPVLPAHHVRIAKRLYDDIKDKLTLGTLNAVVVRHEDTEGVHIHMYLKHETPCTAKTGKKRFREAYGITRTLNQGDWSWSDPRTIEGFWAYTMSGFKQKKRHQFDNLARVGATCIVWGIQEPRLPDYPQRPEVPIVSTTDTVTLRIPKPSKVPKMVQFLEHARTVFEGSHEHITKQDVVRCFMRWSQHGADDYTYVRCVRHAYYALQSDETRELVENDFIEKIISKI